MKWTPVASLGLVAAAYAAPAPEGVPGNLTPDSSAPEGCKPDYDGKFEVTIGRLGKREIERRGCDNPNALLLTLSGGVLKDAKDRTGYIASNYQFQFDGPPQAGAIYTAGFSVCGNNSLALGSKTVWYQCLSGSFYNLYDHNWAAQCEPVEIIAMSCNGGSGGSGGGSGESGAGKTTVGTQIVQTTVVTAIADGQPQVHTTTIAVPMCQIGAYCYRRTAPITEISDGQPQAPTATVQPAPPPVTEISDGQPQAPTGAPITEISDGQPQAPTGPIGPPVTEISDGQPQAPLPTGTGAGTGTGIVPVRPPPTNVPINSGSKALPGTMVAFAIAFLGVIVL
ncbi:Cell wall mannoprotein CIS3 [Cladobotryum mycophilum]|uniref:Cell wall mannoprotein CIS3 n=1 Tax=Cladobotryum mycophilum TaxID=491253 RepID=A0ABR0SWT3_9HYPO